VDAIAAVSIAGCRGTNEAVAESWWEWRKATADQRKLERRVRYEHNLQALRWFDAVFLGVAVLLLVHALVTRSWLESLIPICCSFSAVLRMVDRHRRAQRAPASRG
jgi:hypothetical protein